jgi:hypothetical protein
MEKSYQSFTGCITPREKSRWYLLTTERVWAPETLLVFRRERKALRLFDIVLRLIGRKTRSLVSIAIIFFRLPVMNKATHNVHRSTLIT